MKIAFSGSHGTGKTTSVFTECTIHKHNSNKEIGILTEVARKCPFPINKETDENSQLWIFSTQLKEEIELSKLYDIVICDRSIIDIIAYTSFISKELSGNMVLFSINYINSYDKIYFKKIENNQYLLDDGIRDTDDEWQQQVEDKMLEYYKIIGYNKLIFI